MKVTLVSFSISVIVISPYLLAGPNEVEIESGWIRGSASEGVLSFKGIPYAQPPVERLRWRSPQLPPDWQGVRETLDYGPDCKQLPFPGDAAPLGVEPNEDCLYVNVWTPGADPAAKLPVMIWIYGGGFVNGGSSPAVYDGAQFARNGVVLVSFNYRLGRFGFFAHPALSKESPDGLLGNYAYMDQVALLQWVQRNITAFGGDPRNVTLFGESAGGGSVLAMTTSPLSKGLFHKAIVQSGGGREGVFPPRYLRKTSQAGVPSGESVGLAFASKVGIEGEGADALEALRDLPAETIVSGLNMATMMNPTYAGPMIDGKVIVETPVSAYETGRAALIPLIIGATDSDIGFPQGRTKDDLFAPFGPDDEKARKAYDPTGSGSVFEVGVKISSDQWMVEPARYFARLFSTAGVTAYQYRFSYVAESMRRQWRGAPHATEIPYVFNTVEARYGDQLTQADKACGDVANQYWVNFAKTGNPNGPGLPEWPAYSREEDVLLDFTLEGPVARRDPWIERLDLIERVANRSD